MWVNTSHILPWLNSVTLRKGEELGQRRRLRRFIRPRVYTVIPIIHKVTCWEIQSSCSLSACCPWLLGWNERLSSWVHLLDNTEVYRDGWYHQSPDSSPSSCSASVYCVLALHSLICLSCFISLTHSLFRDLILLYVGAYEISPSLCKVPFAGLAFHKVNSVEAFFLPQWVFLDAGPNAEGDRSSKHMDTSANFIYCICMCVY